MNSAHFEIKQIKQRLIGATILRPIVYHSTPKQSFGFQVRAKSGKTLNVWVKCDEEGNGPGHLSIEQTSQPYSLQFST